MEFEYLSGGILKEEEDEEDDSGFSTSTNINVEDVDVEQRLRERRADIYENIVSDAAEDFEGGFSVEDVRNEIRPPYTGEEVENVLDYAVEQGELAKENELYVSE